jgi:hypothetical protein
MKSDEFLGLWEKLSNPGFKPLEFERFKNEAGSNYFVLSPQHGLAPGRAVQAAEPNRHPPDANPYRRQPQGAAGPEGQMKPVKKRAAGVPAEMPAVDRGLVR